MLRYRTTDPLQWGTGIGVDLTPAQVDENFWTLDERVVYLENLPPPGASIDYFIIEGDQLTVVMDDYTTRGPYTLPTVTINFRGEWAVDTEYFVNDLFTFGASLYIVLIAHTSESTGFDPGLQIEGQDVYGFCFEIEGMLPTGGATGQWLRKASSADFIVEWADSPIPLGGDTGQVLRKASNLDDDTEWGNIEIAEAADVEEVATPEHGHILRWSDSASEYKKQQDFPPQDLNNGIITLTASHMHKLSNITDTDGAEITVPAEADWAANTLHAGAMAHFRQGTHGAMVVIEDDGVDVRGIAGFTHATAVRGAVITLYYAGSDVWYLYGMLTVGDEYDT